jgi:hypothetical protein
MTAELEVVVDRSVSGEKSMCVPDRLELTHAAFPASGRLVRDLTAIVEISALPMFNAQQDLTFRSTIGPEFIGHDNSGNVAQTLQQLAKEALGGFLVAAALRTGSGNLDSGISGVSA